MAKSNLDSNTLEGWFAGRLPDDWFTGPATVTADREEILVVGTLSEPEYPNGADAAAKGAAERARIQRFREDTREQRMKIADEAEVRTGRKVAWGARCGDEERVFTSLAVPVMTRLRMQQRQVLDTLVDAGVARSRSDASVWCVSLVRDHEGEWIEQLRDALVVVEARVRVRTYAEWLNELAQHPLLETVDAELQEHDREADQRDVDRPRGHVRDAARERHAHALAHIDERVDEHDELQPRQRRKALPGVVDRAEERHRDDEQAEDQRHLPRFDVCADRESERRARSRRTTAAT